MTDATRFPLDFNALNRGDTIPAEAVEKAVLCRRDEDVFRFKMLALKASIQEWFLTNRGDFVSVVCENDGLRILTHPEQSDYAARRGAKGVQSIGTAVKELMAVDVSALTDDDQKQRHSRVASLNAFRLQQLSKPMPPRLEP